MYIKLIYGYIFFAYYTFGSLVYDKKTFLSNNFAEMCIKVLIDYLYSFIWYMPC